MSSMWFLEPKATESVEISKALRKYIQENFSQAAEDYEDALKSLEGLRHSVSCPERHESGIQVMLRYFGQLEYLQSRFPINENQIKLKFIWTDSITGKKLSSYNLNFEKACILFNIAAIQSKIASSQNIGSDEGLKMAAKYYQSAAGMFQYLEENMEVYFSESPSEDLTRKALNAFSLICLASAQECFWSKAKLGNMKDAIIAKLAIHTADLYDDAYNALLVEGKGMGERLWGPILQVKRLFFLAVSQYHQSLVAKESCKYGEEIGRLQKASSWLKDVSKLAKSVGFDISPLENRVTSSLASAQRENDIIYHELIPSFSDMSIIQKAAMVKPTPPDLNNPAVVGADLFSSIVPLWVTQAESLYTEKKAQLIREETQRLEESTNLANSLLASMNLPAAIEALEQPEGVPRPLIEKSKLIVANGGIKRLQESLENLESICIRDSEILAESLRVLDEEEKYDETLRSKYGAHWKRTPSANITRKLREDYQKYKTTLEKAAQSDALVRKKFAANKANISNLCLSESELASMIPNTSAAKLNEPRKSAYIELKQLLFELRKIGELERSQLDKQLREMSSKDDIVSKLLQGSHGESNRNAIMEESLKKYLPVQEAISSNIDHQDLIMSSIQKAHQNFAPINATQDSALVQRENALKNLDAAYLSYKELDANISEGSTFYNEVAETLLKFQTKCNDFSFARKTEASELIDELEKVASTKNPPPSRPLAPSYHAPFPGYYQNETVSPASSFQSQPPPFYSFPPSQGGQPSSSVPTLNNSPYASGGGGGGYYAQPAPSDPQATYDSRFPPQSLPSSASPYGYSSSGSQPGVWDPTLSARYNTSYQTQPPQQNPPPQPYNPSQPQPSHYPPGYRY